MYYYIYYLLLLLLNIYIFTYLLPYTHTHIHTYIYARTCIHMYLIWNRCVDRPFHRFLIAPHIPHGCQAGKQVMYRSPPLRQERKIVEDTTDDEAHAKDHKVCPGWQSPGVLGMAERWFSRGTKNHEELDFNEGLRGTHAHSHTQYIYIYACVCNVM